MWGEGGKESYVRRLAFGRCRGVLTRVLFPSLSCFLLSPTENRKLGLIIIFPGYCARVIVLFGNTSITYYQYS